MKRSPAHSNPSLDDLAKDVLRLSRLLTRDRDDLPASYLSDPGLRNAYLRYFLPSNLAKIHLPLRELARHPAGLLDRDRLRVLDLGSGPGTSVLGMLEFFGAEKHGPRLEFTALDQVAGNLRSAEQLFREHRLASEGKAGLRTVKGPVTDAIRLCSGEYDIIILSNVLNELFSGNGDRIARRAELTGTVLETLLAPEGACIIIEPALRETSRELLLVRDTLLDKGLTVYSPCLVQDHCPALADSKDWCHEEVPWSPPELVREIDRRIGLRKDALKFSYVVLRRDGRSLAEVCGEGALRVVSEPLTSKGKLELYVCGKGGRKLAMRQDKDRSAHNARFDDLRRGSVARFEGMVSDEKRHRVVKETKVTVLSHPGSVEGKP